MGETPFQKSTCLRTDIQRYKELNRMDKQTSKAVNVSQGLADAFHL